jgi:hypothetical protein
MRELIVTDIINVKEFVHMQKFVVGEPLPFTVEQGTSMELSESGITYFISIKNVAPSEIEATRSGKLECCLFVRQPAIFVLFNIPDLFNWSDTPFSVHLSKGKYDLSHTYQDQEGIAIQIVVHDFNDDSVKALRIFDSSTDFANAFIKAAKQQQDISFDLEEYDKHIFTIQKLHSCMDMAYRGEGRFTVKKD